MNIFSVMMLTTAQKFDRLLLDLSYNCNVLEFAGLNHRDFKTENILYGPEGFSVADKGKCKHGGVHNFLFFEHEKFAMLFLILQ